MNRRVRPGFTLIELLVVIAVIVVLAMMLFPALGSIRENGRCARCRSNLHQLQVAAIQMAAADKYSNMPRAGSTNIADATGRWFHKKGWLEWSSNTKDGDSTQGKYYWEGANGTNCVTNGTLFVALGGYASAQASANMISVYVCPTHQYVAKTKSVTCSYSMNVEFKGGWDPVPLTHIDYPASMVLFGDSVTITNATANSGAAFFVPIKTNVAGRVINQLATIHRGKANAVFVDGHADTF